jgi:hypothetical protein
MPEHDQGAGALPPAMARPRWCRHPDVTQRWLPWDVHALLNALNGSHRYLTGVQLGEQAGVGLGTAPSVIMQLEGLGLVAAAPERELFAESWKARGHNDGCGCPSSWYYSITQRGRLWLETYRARPRPPRWKRPGFWIGLAVWVGFCYLMGALVF